MLPITIQYLKYDQKKKKKKEYFYFNFFIIKY